MVQKDDQSEPNYINKIQTMNKYGNGISMFVDQVFLQKDEKQELDTLKRMAIQSDAEQIRNYFLGENKRHSIDPNRLVQTQINKHIKVLNHQNKVMLKELLKQTPEAGKKPQEIKSFHEQKTLWSMCDEDREIHQYLSFDDEIDFDLLAKER